MATSSLVDVHTLAQFWEVDIRTVQNYADVRRENPPLPREAHGKYNFVKAMQWMYNRLKTKIEILDNGGDEKLYALKMKGQIIKNKKDEINLKRDMAKILDKKTTLIAWSNQINTIKNFLNALKYDLRRDLDGIAESEEQAEVINAAVNRIMKIISKLEIESIIVDEEKLLETPEPEIEAEQ